MKKKTLFGILIIMICVVMVGCGKEEKENEKEEGTIAGGWTVVFDEYKQTMPEEATKAFEKAMENYDGIAFEPVALLGTQVVSGTNYMYLCKGSNLDGSNQKWNVVVVYNNLEGEAQVSKVNDFDITKFTNVKEETEAKEIVGGWEIYADFEAVGMEPQAKEAFEKATEGLDGATYKPIKLLGTQVVAGTNYLVLCETTTVTQTPTSKLVVLSIYRDLEGNATINSNVTVDLAEYNK